MMSSFRDLWKSNQTRCSQLYDVTWRSEVYLTYLTELEFFSIKRSASDTSSRLPFIDMFPNTHGAAKSRRYLLVIENDCIAVNSSQRSLASNGNWPGISHICSNRVGSGDFPDIWATYSQIMYSTSSLRTSRVVISRSAVSNDRPIVSSNQRKIEKIKTEGRCWNRRDNSQDEREVMHAFDVHDTVA